MVYFKGVVFTKIKIAWLKGMGRDALNVAFLALKDYPTSISQLVVICRVSFDFLKYCIPLSWYSTTFL
jgi:hypothetical protein